jgi:thiol-disulfide isomerase/thioredoxin
VDDSNGAADAGATTPTTSEPVAPAESRLSRKAAWLAMGAVTLALGLIWLAPGIDHVDDSATTSAGSPGEPEDAAAAGKPARLDFKLKDMHGVDVRLDSFKGKVILINFWATWCGPCKAEIPGFVELQEKYRDKLTIIGYSVDDTAELAKKYAAEYKMNYPILLGEGREDVQDAYGPIWGIPASFIISKDGKVCRKHMGIAPKAVFEKELIALM